MIFDHVSVTWGRDETFSISGEVYNVTVQDSIIGQGLETHSCGGLMQTDHGVSLFRNLYIDNKTRNPKVVSTPHPPPFAIFYGAHLFADGRFRPQNTSVSSRRRCYMIWKK